MKKIRSHLTFFLLFLPLASYLLAQQPLDLKTALQYTLQHHASVKRASIEVAKGRELIRESMSGGLPQIGANLGLTNNIVLQTSFVPAEFFGGQPGEFAKVQFGTNWNSQMGVQLNQQLFDKAWLLGVKATQQYAAFNELLLDKTREDVVADVAKLYYQIQLTRTQRGILDANLRQIKSLTKVIDLQILNGVAKRIDLDRLTVQQSNLETQITNLNLQAGQLEQTLKMAMNMPLETDIVLTDTISTMPIGAVNTSLTQPTYQNKTTLLILQKQQELYQLDTDRWKAAYFPTLSLFGNYNYQWQANKLGELGNSSFWTDFSQVGVQINVPIFDGFFKKSKVQTAQLNKQQYAQDYNLAKLGLQLAHEAAVTSLKVNQNSLVNIVATQKVAEEVYRVAQSRYREGLAPITELLDAESSLRQTQANYITALAQMKLAEIELLSANGQLMKLAE